MTEMVLYTRVDGLLEPGDDETLAYVQRLAPAHKLVVKAPNTETGSIPMLRTWRGWMNETATFMAWRGCKMPLYIDSTGTPQGSRIFNADDAHEMFTRLWLGVDEKGNRYSWAMRSKDPEVVVAPKSRRLFAMDKHLEWSIEKGITLTIPRHGEYADLKRKEHA